ncbi:amidase family protein [Kocuria sp. cx-455]|uniref:amidase family protein n=1 Tax=Kocuria sp. cx-455 TaxID=2771377 RepID=UPI003D704D8D
MNTHLTSLPIREQVRLVTSGDVTARELALDTRELIDSSEHDLRAWVSLVDPKDLNVRNSAPAPLQGLSIGVKDLIDVRGLPTLCGSTITHSAPAPDDAACVQLFRSLGAVVQGKTVTTEFGYFSPGPTTNPYDAAHTPGGSSSGSAAAVGAGSIALALGTQTAGSLTRPASYCGAAGMVLAHGSMNLTGITGLSHSLDSLGLLTRTLEDMSYVYRAMEPMAPAPALPSEAYFWWGSDLHPLDKTMIETLSYVKSFTDSRGLRSRDLNRDDHVRTLAEDHVTVMSYEAAQSRGSLLELPKGSISAPLTDILRHGQAVSRRSYDAALTRSERTKTQIAELLNSSGIIVGPAAPGAAPSGLNATGSPILSRPWQLLGLPVVVVPGANDTLGMPLGIQLIGLSGCESTLLAFGQELETFLRNQLPQPLTSPRSNHA